MQGKQGASFNNNHLIFVRERKGTLGFPGGSSGKEPTPGKELLPMQETQEK